MRREYGGEPGERWVCCLDGALVGVRLSKCSRREGKKEEYVFVPPELPMKVDEVVVRHKGWPKGRKRKGHAVNEKG